MKKDNLWKKKGISFITSQAITLFGSSIVQMAIVWYVTMQTSSGIWLTILTLSSFLPQMIISPFAGVWADRYNKKSNNSCRCFNSCFYFNFGDFFTNK